MKNEGQPVPGGAARCIFVTTQDWLHKSSLWRFSLFWDVTQRRLVVTDVSGQPIGPIFERHSVQEEAKGGGGGGGRCILLSYYAF
jgi:hypothetical protein